MPYRLSKSKKGYKVKDNKGKSYSKKPLPKSRAKKQMTALRIKTNK